MIGHTASHSPSCDAGARSNPSRVGSDGVEPARRALGLLGLSALLPVSSPGLAQGAIQPASGGPAAATVAAPAARPPVIVLNSRDASVSLVDQNSFQETGRIAVGKEPHHLYLKPDGRSLIVANAISNDLHFLDPVTGALQRRIRNIDDPYQIGFSPDNRWFAAIGLRLDRVDLYHYDGVDLSLSRRVPCAKAPSHVWFSADSRLAFVTLQDSDEIAAIDLAAGAVAWKLKVGRQPAGIIITPDDRWLMVGIMGEDHVDVIDWRERRSVAKIRTGKGAHNFRGAGDRRHLWVSNRVENTISRIDMQSHQVVQTIAVPGGPDCMEIADDRRTMWVTSRFIRQVSVVDLAQGKLVRAVPVGRSPHGVFMHNRAPLL